MRGVGRGDRGFCADRGRGRGWDVYSNSCAIDLDLCLVWSFSFFVVDAHALQASISQAATAILRPNTSMRSSATSPMLVSSRLWDSASIGRPWPRYILFPILFVSTIMICCFPTAHRAILKKMPFANRSQRKDKDFNICVEKCMR